jgi:integrase/recombinase XerD
MKFDPALAPTSPAIQPIELLAIPENLDGKDGTNRKPADRAQIAARNDVEAVKAWLSRYADTETTFQNYRKEAERLLLWSTLQLGKPLSSLTHEDLLAFRAFLMDPQPATRWVLVGKQKLRRDHPGWRPFAGPLAPASQRQALLILNGMFSWLVTAGYLAGNPLALSRQRARKGKARVARYLAPAAWNEVKASVEAMPRETARQCEHYARDRWILSLLFLGGFRVTELADNTMGGFYMRRDREGVERWWLEVTGKGKKLRQVPATDELMVELSRYRRAYKLAPLPSVGEATPLVLPIGGAVRHMSRAALHAVIKQIFEGAAKRIEVRGEIYHATAALLRQASAHWLRHTAGSSMADGALDLRFVRDNLGHESLSTTSIYLHSEDDERHRETGKKLRIAWRN